MLDGPVVDQHKEVWIVEISNLQLSEDSKPLITFCRSTQERFIRTLHPGEGLRDCGEGYVYSTFNEQLLLNLAQLNRRSRPYESMNVVIVRKGRDPVAVPWLGVRTRDLTILPVAAAWWMLPTGTLRIYIKCLRSKSNRYLT